MKPFKTSRTRRTVARVSYNGRLWDKDGEPYNVNKGAA